MSHSSRSAGAPGPWLADDDLATVEGAYTGPAAGDASADGTLTLDGLTAAADVVNVWEQATRMSVGGLMSPAFHKKRQSSNPQRKR